MTNVDTAKTIKVFQPLPKKPLVNNQSIVRSVESDLIASKYDAAGWKRELLDRTNDATRLRPGDIVRVHKADKTHFSGMVVGINRNGLATSVLVRNKITGLGVENRFLLFSPTVEKVYVVRKPIKAKRRAKLYYVRGSAKHDVNEVS